MKVHRIVTVTDSANADNVFRSIRVKVFFTNFSKLLRYLTNKAIQWKKNFLVLGSYRGAKIWKSHFVV
jgi:hypothetical protein